MNEEEEAQRRAKAKSLRPLLSLLPMLWTHRMKLFLAFLALLSASCASLAIPITVREVIDNSFTTQSQFNISIFFIAGGIAMFLALSSAARFYFVTVLGERIGADLRQKVFSHILSLEPSFFEKIRVGEVISRLSADMVLVRTILVSSTSIAIRNLLLMFGAIVMLIVTSPSLSSIVLIVIPLFSLPLLGFGRIVRRLSRKAQDRLADTGAMANEILGAIQTVQSLTYETTARKRFAHAAEIAFQSAAQRVAVRAILVAVIISVVLLAILFMFYQGTLAVMDESMTAGTLGQFILYALIAAASLVALGEVWGDLQLAAGATERLFELAAEKARITSLANAIPLPDPVGGNIKFDSVDFAYPSRPNIKVFDRFSFDIPAGSITALVGLSGAGKSTMFHLLNRFDDPQTGHITLDGINLRDCNLTALRQQLASVLQEPVLFSMSIADNILYANPHASMDEVIQAAKQAAAHDFIEALPQGYHTVIGERGVMLSGGQRQRIAIARAFLRNAPILLLDEATSALDAENEEIIQQALLRLEQKKTVIIIAHRLTTVQRADNIAIMENGQISFIGTHEELLYQSALYRRLAKNHFVIQKQPRQHQSKSLTA